MERDTKAKLYVNVYSYVKIKHAPCFTNLGLRMIFIQKNTDVVDLDHTCTCALIFIRTHLFIFISLKLYCSTGIQPLGGGDFPAPFITYL